MKSKYLFVLTAVIFLLFTHSAYAEDGYIVKLKDTPYSYGSANLFDAENNMEKLSGSVYYVESTQTLDALLESGSVEYCEENQTVYLFDSSPAEYNDTYFDSQWYWDIMDISYLRKITSGNSSVRVAVIDSGICYEHPDFADSIIERGYDYTAGTDNATAEYFHGVMVTGIICASANNNEGIAGIADGVTVVPVKCFSGKTTSLKYIIPAIYAAADTFDCDFINMSFGIENKSTSLMEAINYAADKGIITVAAAGNDGSSALYYPAGFDNVIGVGAVQRSGSSISAADYSQKNTSVYITAPGSSVISTSYKDIGASRIYNYDTRNGTSFAAPMVTAFLAAAKSIYPELTLSDAFEILKESAVDSGDEGYDTVYGHGVMNMKKGIDYLIRSKNISVPTQSPLTSPPPPAASANPSVAETLHIDITENTSENTITLNITDNNAENDGILIIALYDENGSVIETKLYKLAIEEGGNIVYNIKGYEYKVMLWSGFENMSPLEHTVEKHIHPDYGNTE